MSRTAIALAIVLALACATAGVTAGPAAREAVSPAARETTSPAASPSPHRIVELIELRVIELGDGYVGVAWDGEHFWVSRHATQTDPPMFHVIDEYGVEQASFAQEQVNELWGHEDLTFADGYVWGGFGSEIRAIDPATGGYVNYFVGPIDPCTTMVTDGTYWYVNGFSRHIHRGIWDGVWGSEPDWETITVAPVPGGTCMALDEMRNCLWVGDAKMDDLYRYELDGQCVGWVELDWVDGLPSGLTMAETPSLGTVLAILYVDNTWGRIDRLVLYELRDATAVERSSWTKVKALFR